MFIYLIVNHATGKYYVGQHKGNNLRKYLQKKLWAAKHKVAGSSHLFNSMRKYPDHSIWSVHALLSDVQTKAELDQHERDFIAFLKSRDPKYGYNICRGGEGNTGSPSVETRKKLSAASKRSWSDPDIRKSHHVKLRGRKQPPDAVAKMRNTRRRKYGQSGYPGLTSFKDMTGTVVNGISILSRLANAKDGAAVWLCRCTCGKAFPARAYSLRSGHTKSCGCLKIRQDQVNLKLIHRRAMIPRKLVVPPWCGASEVMALRAHIDEAVTDPDYSVVVSYECRWDEADYRDPEVPLRRQIRTP